LSRTQPVALVYHFTTIIGRWNLPRERQDAPESPESNEKRDNRNEKRGHDRRDGRRDTVCHRMPDRAFLRSTVWSAGAVAVLGLFVVACLAI